MHRAIDTALVWVLAAACHSAVAAEGGFACVLLGKPTTKVQAPGGSFNLPVLLDDCVGVVIESEGITMCVAGETLPRRCQELVKGKKITAHMLQVGPAAARAASSTVLALLRGDIQVRQAQTRTSVNDIGLPSGIVLGVVRSFAIALPAELQGSTAALTLAQLGVRSAPIVAGPMQGSSVTLPSDALTPGESYAWTVATPQRSFSGQFTVAGTEYAPLRAQLRAIDDDPSISPVAKAYLRATLLADDGFDFERDLEIQTLSKRLNAQ